MKLLKKLLTKTSLPLLEYVLIEQEFVDIEICQRSEGWMSEHFLMDDQVTFESLDLTVSVEDIYQRANIEDAHAFYAEQQ